MLQALTDNHHEHVQDHVRKLAEALSEAASLGGLGAVELALRLTDLHDFARGPRASMSLNVHRKALQQLHAAMSLVSCILSEDQGDEINLLHAQIAQAKTVTTAALREASTVLRLGL
jgi:hypothetical protein